MKKFIAAAVIAIALAAFVGTVPAAVESMAPVCETFSPSVRSYSEKISGSGKVRYVGQSAVSCSLPVVIKEACVSEGDRVQTGDIIAKIDRESSVALVMSLSQINALNAAVTDLQAAAALIPEAVAAESAGRVVSVSRAGQAVLSGESIAVIADNDSIAVSAAISELDIAKIKLGQPAYIELSAYPGEKIFGTVSEISETARSQYSGTVLETVVDIMITPENTGDERLKSGFSAEVEIGLSEPYDILVAPYSAIEQDEISEYVYVYENGAAVRRNIVTGKEFSDGTEVCVGLSAGDIVFKAPGEVAEQKYIRIKDSN
ncbi:MAG: HlyD family efflux transporter periplasmic adaptor subunit [Oscillospiraceae bacterium]|nr:HlyD family efflux transporter periplasmic adaptor subunit [Oscillospiraceae bacterium]